MDPNVLTDDASGPESAAKQAQARRIGVAAVVVTYNRLDILKRCLLAVRNQSYGIDAIIAVDNASTDGTREYLDRLNWPNLIVEHLPVNSGGAGGFFHGMEVACRMRADLIWLMDDDCIPEPNALEEIVVAQKELVERNVPHTFLCSRVVDIYGRSNNIPMPSKRRNASAEFIWADLLGQGMILVDECSFVSVAVTMDAVAQAGLPLREMFIWGDDVEYTQRLSKIAPGVLVGRSLVHHERENPQGSLIWREQNPRRIKFIKMHYRNYTYIFRQHFTSKQLVVYILRSLRDAAQLLLAGQVYKSWMVLSGVLEGLSFRGDIKFVDSNSS